MFDELGTLLKDRDDQQPAEWTIRIYNFISILLFLNSDIGIVILYIVKYIRKAFSLPKKSILKFKIWQISTFLGSLLATYIAIILTFKRYEMQSQTT